MNNSRPVIELRRVGHVSENGYSYEIILHHIVGVTTILAKLEQDLPVEMCRRFAADAASYYGAVFDDQTAANTAHHYGATLDDQTTSRPPDYERWLKHLLKDIKMQDRETI
jgi:hypothetical protein